MSGLERLCLASLLIFSSSFSVFGQWFPVDSGTTTNLNRAYLLDSGIRLRRGRYGHDSEDHRSRGDMGATFIGNNKSFA